jgi:hypothetical protein
MDWKFDLKVSKLLDGEYGIEMAWRFISDVADRNCRSFLNYEPPSDRGEKESAEIGADLSRYQKSSKPSCDLRNDLDKIQILNGRTIATGFFFEFPHIILMPLAPEFVLFNGSESDRDRVTVIQRGPSPDPDRRDI